MLFCSSKITKRNTRMNPTFMLANYRLSTQMYYRRPEKLNQDTGGAWGEVGGSFNYSVCSIVIWLMDSGTSHTAVCVCEGTLFDISHLVVFRADGMTLPSAIR